MNSVSSRSHMIVTIVLTFHNKRMRWWILQDRSESPKAVPPVYNSRERIVATKAFQHSEMLWCLGEQRSSSSHTIPKKSTDNVDERFY
jgi:hypothetical protein